MKHRELLPRIKAEIERVAPGAEIILYGSVARGEETEESDIDLLIVVDRDADRLTYKEEEAIVNPLFHIEIETGIIISPKVRTRRQWLHSPVRTPFFYNVMKEGIRL